MNFKKLAITAAATGVMLSAAMPALAHGNGGRGGDLEVKIENKDTTVRNNVNTTANTGQNEVNGSRGHRHHGSSNGGSINTGDALAASDVYNNVNNSTVDLCGCLSGRRGDVEVKIENKDTTVRNNVNTTANTGQNEVNGSGRIRTGDAGSEGIVTNYVNTNVVN